MIKRLLIMLLVVGIVLGGIFGFIRFKNNMIKQYMASMGDKPQTVSTIVADYQDWSSSTQTIANLTAVHGVDISAEVSGIVTDIYFQQGDEVQQGALLLQLRADDEKAKLKALQAEQTLARITYQRNIAQLQANAISQQIVDNDKALLAKLTANIAEQQALIAKKQIHAPFAGRLGIRLIDLGQYVNAGTPIVTLQALDSLYVDFFLPQHLLAKIAIGQKVTVNVDAYPEQSFTANVNVINAKVDVNTRNVQIRAVLNNPTHQLLPGMYATVNINTDKIQRLITLPNSAISFNSYGSTVFLIEPDKDKKQISKQVFVTTGATRGDQVAIIKGIKEGDIVVTSGQIKLRNGSTVLINNSIQPNNAATPTIADQ